MRGKSRLVQIFQADFLWLQTRCELPQLGGLTRVRGGRFRRERDRRPVDISAQTGGAPGVARRAETRRERAHTGGQAEWPLAAAQPIANP